MQLLRAREVGGVFKVKTISSNIWCAPPCKNSETVPRRATHFPAVCAVHSDARRSMPPDKSQEWFTQRLWQGWTRWNNGRRGWFSSYEGGDMTLVTPPRVGMNLVTEDFEFTISTATQVTTPLATQKSMSASTLAHQLCAVSPSRCTPQIRNNYN